jgi:hypothetical protein
VLRRELGDGFGIIEEGLNGRTTVWDDPLEPFRSGKELLVPCLLTHQPIDLVIVMLGTNDLKGRFGVGARDIAAGAGFLLDIVRASDCGPEGSPPQVLLVCPPPVGASAYSRRSSLAPSSGPATSGDTIRRSQTLASARGSMPAPTSGQATTTASTSTPQVTSSSASSSHNTSAGCSRDRRMEPWQELMHMPR